MQNGFIARPAGVLNNPCASLSIRLPTVSGQLVKMLLKVSKGAKIRNDTIKYHT